MLRLHVRDRTPPVTGPKPHTNASSWGKRFPVLLLAAVGFSISSYIAGYQLNWFGRVWEPFFGRGSEVVLHSFVSRLLPVPDAALGSVGYLAELITGLLGGEHRCRTSPHLVLIYGGIAAALAGAAVLLTALQVFVLHACCTLCLTSALISGVIAWLASREVLASVAELRSS